MQKIHRFEFMLLGLLSLTMASCGFPGRDARRAETPLEPAWPKPNNVFRQASLPAIRAALPTIEGAEYVNDDELCLTCHKVYTETFADNVHRGIHEQKFACEACHGPASRHLETRGKEPGLVLNFKRMQPVEAAEVCLQCHEQNACAPGAQWRTSVHAHHRLSCTSCHQSHYNVPPGTPATTEPDLAATGRRTTLRLASFQEGSSLPSLAGTSNNLNAVSPDVCFRCHGDMAQQTRIAGPHQLCGPNGFSCSTCHDPHGKILEQSRQELCLTCHQQGSPTMAWHSSTHSLMGVACTDCHNPHPRGGVQQFPANTGVSLVHTNVARPVRRAMAVQEPEACFKCHPKVYAEGALPSHHPVKEGKMSCSDCHDPHGQMEGGLKAESLNLLCWKCHAEKQGPFAYEHPPVTENCGYCHAPHGTVANNLLKQPAAFLCLRCHVGHNNRGHNGGGTRTNIDATPQLRGAYYTDCTACHQQIHGSDLPSQNHLRGGMFR